MENAKSKLRMMVRGAYDLQRLRIQSGLRLCANFRNQIGQKPDMKEAELDDEAKKILKELRETYKRLTDGIAGNRLRPEQFKGEGLIADFTIFNLTKAYFNMLDTEEEQFSALTTILPEFPIYNQFLKNVKGVGPMMAAVILSELDIYKAKYPSSFFMYAGLDVAPDGKGRSRREEHLVKKEYRAKDGTIKEKLSITYNPFLKAKLCGVLASSFLRAKAPYADVYYGYKTRLQNKPDWSEETKGRINRAALRYMIKIFLIDLHVKWREVEGLPVSEPYSAAKLNLPFHSPHQENRPSV